MQTEYTVFIYEEIYTQTHVTVKETEATDLSVGRRNCESKYS